MISKRITYCAVALACLISSHAMAGGSSFGFGIEGFNENYKEQDLGNTGKTNGGSLTGYFSHALTKRTFFAMDGRLSYGTQDFSSTTGSVSNIPQWELELRARVGITYQMWGGEVSPYIGAGYRYLVVQGKGYTTDLGFEDYDRYTSQFYIPVGASYSYGFGDGWMVTPQAEADFMLLGVADSHMTNITNGAPVSSQCSPSCNGFQFLNAASDSQYFGIGGRSELMFGKDLGGYSIEAGPFIRYWYIPESDKTPYHNITNNGPATINYSVPKNTDLQAGVGLKLLF